MKEFNVLNWQSLDLKIREKQFIIRAFGRTMPDNEEKNNDEVICLEIRGFKPYFYFEIQEQLENGEWKNKNFEKHEIEFVLKSLESKIGKEECFLNTEEESNLRLIDKKIALLKRDVFTEIIYERIKIVKKIKFDYFRNNQKDSFYQIYFKTKRAFNLYKKLLRKVTKNEDFEYEDKIYRFIQYESNIEPIIRFFHEQKINPSGWIKCEYNSEVLKSGNTMVQENIKAYYCKSYRDVIPVDNNVIAPFKIASFDIECTSDDGNFPQAKRKKDKIIQIGITTHRQGELNPYEQCIITLNETRTSNLKFKSVFDFGDVKSIICKNEKKLLLEFTKYIRDELDPDIITGYNIWGFDWMYMYQRALLLDDDSDDDTDSDSEDESEEKLKLSEKFCKMSRVSYETCRYVEKSLSSSALGDNFLKYIEMTGRVQIDLLKLVQKDYNLSSYKLTAVSANFLQGNVELVIDENLSKEELTFCEYHKIKSRSIDGIYVDNQISLIDQFENKVKNGYKFTVSDLDKENNIITVKENLRSAFNQHEGELEQEMKDLNLEFDKRSIKYRWCENKIDLPPQNIFDNFKKNTAESMKEIAIYCIKDCVLCNSLIIKLDVITKNIGMSNVCCVPFSYLFLRGQGVKIFSVISQECQQEGFIMPLITKEDFKGDASYEGAIVLEPKTGIYFKPVAVMDYSSLYPSSMISENISHDSLVKIEIVDNEGKTILEKGSGVENPSLMKLDKEDIPIKERYGYKRISYNNYNKEKEIIGKTICTYVQPPENTKSVLPKVLQKLLKARKDTRKRQKSYSKDDFMWSILEGLQLAYKVVCNSLYGQVGASTSPVCKTELAASTTAVGRELLELAKDMTLKNYKGSECVYGDSILGDEPLLLKLNDKIYIKTIETISKEWIQYEGFKINESNRKEKEQSFCDYMVWTNNKWSKIKRVIRHKTNKKIYRVNTHCGLIDVTEDHSLLNKNKEIIKPEDCKINETELLQSFPKFENDNENYKVLHLNEIMDILNKYEKYERTFDEKEAFIYGVFYGDGSCGKYDTKWGLKYTWALNNQDDKLLNMCLLYLQEIYGNETSFKILDTSKSSGVKKLVPYQKIKCMVDKFRPLFYNKDKLKIIPDEIINGGFNIRLNFFLGYYFADGSKCRNTQLKNISFDNKGKLGSSQLYYLVKSLGYKASIRIRKDKPNIFKISCCLGSLRNKQRIKPNIIKKLEHITDINDMNYVYDLETEEGCFNAGIGEIVVKNTDSVFIQFDTNDLSKAINLGKEAGRKVTDKLIADGRQPHDLEYEKTFFPFILLSKKRYVGNKYEEDINKYSQTSMGIVLKRRDNARILKDIYQGVINSILNEEGDKESIMQKAVDFYKNAVNRLMNGEVSFNKLEISKTLKGNYKNPTSIAHKVLADRMRDRDPGNAPAVNDRIPYVYVDVKTLCCNNCNRKNIELKKCTKCLKLYGDCKFRLNGNAGLGMNKEQDVTCYKNHECNIVCRFCHIDLPQNHVPCKTCEGYFCKKCQHECKSKISPKLLQGDRIEHPDYLLENEEIKPDYKYYFEHQIERPVQQIFDLTDRKEDIQEFCKEITMGEEYVRKQKEKKKYVNSSMFKFLQ